MKRKRSDETVKRRRRRRGKAVVLVVATRDPGALRALEELAEGFPLERREALTTSGVYNSLEGADLAVVDVDQLVETGEVSRERVRAVLGEGDISWVTGGKFASDPQRWLDEARARSGLVKALPAQVVAFTSLSGGVGKTTLSLSLARHFRQKTGLPACVIELTLGPSGLSALVGGGRELPHLVDVLTRGVAWPVWEGVTLAPMLWDGATELIEKQVWPVWARSHIAAADEGFRTLGPRW